MSGIYAGERVSARNIGYVADFCPVCRKICVFQIKSIGYVSHILGITYAHGDIIAYERRCQECRQVFDAELTHYASVPNKKMQIGELIAISFPDIREKYRDRFAIEEKIKKSPDLLNAEERRAVLVHPFTILPLLVQRRLAVTHFDRNIVLAFLLVFVFMELLPPYVKELFELNDKEALNMSITLGLLVVASQFFTAKQRYLKRFIAPIVGRSVQTLKPSEAELVKIFKELQQADNIVANKLKISHVLKNIK